jgi:phosphatidate cytidylyltransferase
MNKVFKRLLTFFIGIPLVLLLVFFNFGNHLFLNIIISIFSLLAANEFYNMLSTKSELYPKVLILIETVSLPILSYLFIVLRISQNVTSWVFTFEVIILMAIECFFAKDFKNSITKIAMSSLIIFYCGFMITFITRLTVLDNAVYFVALYFLLVFICDSAAWFFGILFGKNNRGFIAASPNKSIIGFLGGIVAAIASGILFKYFFPQILEGNYWKIFIVSVITAFGAITGDLIESVFKRFSDVKDSGNIIPGRGGVLDSIDSLLIAAPIFYIGVHFLYNL